MLNKILVALCAANAILSLISGDTHEAMAWGCATMGWLAAVIEESKE